MRQFGVGDRGATRLSPRSRAAGSATGRAPTRVEPDASSAHYFCAAAALTGGRVRVEGLGRDSLQGDVRFADVLEQHGRRR